MRVKGVSFRTFLKTLEKLKGPDSMARTRAELPRDIADALHYGAVVPGSWYPLSWYRELHAAAQRGTGSGKELPRQVARLSKLDDFRGIYRVVAFLLSPEALVRKSPFMWRLYYDQGRVVVSESRVGMSRAEWTGCSGFDRNIWEDTAGSAAGVMEALGAKDVRQRIVSGGGDHDDEMVLETRWV